MSKEKGKILEMASPDTPAGKWIKVLAKRAEAEASFTPSRQMERAKARLWAAIRDNPLMTTNITDLTLDAIVELSGASKILDWMDNSPVFLSWLCDEHYERIDLEAMAAKARRVIEDVLDAPLEEKLLTAKDKLNAANLILQLADKFPNKRKEVVYLDRELGRMGEDEVLRESKRLERLLESKKPEGT